MTGWAKAFLKKNTKASKYQNQKITSQTTGRSFGSKLEANLFELLLLRERAGEIKELKQQVRVPLTKAEIVYIPDFSYILTATEIKEYAEAKGFETDAWRIKRRLWMHYGPGTLKVYKARGTTPFLFETIVPKD
jgi:hypothetical protein